MESSPIPLIRSYDTSLAVLSERKDGMLELRFKVEDYLIDVEFLKESRQAFVEFGGIDTVLLVIAGKYGSITKEAREIEMFETDLNNSFLAIGIVVPSIHKRLLGNLFFALRKNKPDFPYKMFPTEAEASEWLRQFLP